jgi:hypothetical protein
MTNTIKQWNRWVNHLPFLASVVLQPTQRSSSLLFKVAVHILLPKSTMTVRTQTQNQFFFPLKFCAYVCEVTLNSHMKCQTGPHQTISLLTGPCQARLSLHHQVYTKERTEQTQLIQSSFFGLCPSSSFLKTRDILESGSVSVFWWRSP